MIAMGMTLIAKQRIGNGRKIDPQQKCNEREAERHDDLQSTDGILQIAKFADPFET
jgi:hypothetical protein